MTLHHALPRRSLPARLWHWLVSEPIADRYDRTRRALTDTDDTPRGTR